MSGVAWIGVGLAGITLLAIGMIAGSAWAQMNEMDDQGEVTTHDDDF